MTLAPLKKIPPVAKVEATKKEDIPTVVKNAKPALEVKPMSKTNSTTNITEPESNTASVSVDEDIDEEIDEFLNSSISASEDFTKEETVSEEASLKADFVDKFQKIKSGGTQNHFQWPKMREKLKMPIFKSTFGQVT